MSSPTSTTHRNWIRTMPARLRLRGRRFGRLTVVRFSHSDLSTRWICRCDCGTIIVASANHLIPGQVKSCGCLYRDTRVGSPIRHGMSGTSEHRIWKTMRQRCENPRSSRFKDYGGRGIRVCARWRKFENFFADMGRRPPGRSIDRIDNDGNYEPKNCRWATAMQQRHNRRA
jgi:hypothetical protein